MSRLHRSIPAEFTRAEEGLRFDYATKTHRGTLQPEVEHSSKPNPFPLVRWIGRLWLRDADPDAKPLTTITSDNHWDAADELHAYAVGVEGG